MEHLRSWNNYVSTKRMLFYSMHRPRTGNVFFTIKYVEKSGRYILRSDSFLVFTSWYSKSFTFREVSTQKPGFIGIWREDDGSRPKKQHCIENPIGKRQGSYDTAQFVLSRLINTYSLYRFVSTDNW